MKLVPAVQGKYQNPATLPGRRCAAVLRYQQKLQVIVQYCFINNKTPPLGIAVNVVFSTTKKSFRYEMRSFLPQRRSSPPWSAGAIDGDSPGVWLFQNVRISCFAETKRGCFPMSCRVRLDNKKHTSFHKIHLPLWFSFFTFHFYVASTLSMSFQAKNKH